MRIPILDGAGNPTWPDKFPLEKIQQLRQTVGQRHLSSQCDMVLDFISHHHVSRIAIETNGLGNALPEIMRDTATRRGIRAPA